MNYAFIHVADIHYRKDAPEGASSIMSAFLKDLAIQMKTLSDYQVYIVFAGDIVRAGQNLCDFEQFICEMDEQLNTMGLTKNYRIITPGNHDLNRSYLETEFEKHIQAYNTNSTTEERFNDFIEGSEFPTGHFSNYENFVRQFARCDEAFRPIGWGCNINDEVGVYCLNTAICSMGGLDNINDEGRLACYTRDLVEWCKRTNCPVKILLHHHPLDHLKPWSQAELHDIIMSNFKLCLSGHNHSPELFYSLIPQKALMCTAPPLFCGKDATLAYSIILIENNEPSAILYREYNSGSFYPSHRLTRNENGRIDFESTYLRHLKEMEINLQHALQAFKGQQTIFIEPKLSTRRQFNDGPNELHALIESPCDALIIAPSGFGLTCLGLHMQLEAFRKHDFWLYIDAEHTKSRKIQNHIDSILHHYDQNPLHIKCIVLDSWNACDIDHFNMVKNISTNYPDLPLIILADDSLVCDAPGNLSKISKDFKILHLQALSKNSMRQLVSNYNSIKPLGAEDVVLSSLTEHLESINIHRTPLNCYTLLRVLDSNYNEKLLNKSKLLKAILFVLFTDYESFSHVSSKPEIEECNYVLGCFCKKLIRQAVRSFDATSFKKELMDICNNACVVLNVDQMVHLLIENHILVERGSLLEFRHRYWIFYFAAEGMGHDDEFRQFILDDRNYVNYPEIIEFYSGIDGKRVDAMTTLLNDLTSLSDQVAKSIGIDHSFDPLSQLLWNPSDEYIQIARNQIAEKVESSNLPANIKDKHADHHYHSEAPYDQSIRTFLNDYSVLSLLNSIKAASRALRSSPFVKTDLRHNVMTAIIQGWEEISRVVFWLSPLLAEKGYARHDGFALMLADGFSEDMDVRFKQIITSNPYNIVKLLRNDLASKKISPLLEKCFLTTESNIQKHMLALFIVNIRPIGWYDMTLNYINLLHPRSFFFGDLLIKIREEIEIGDLEHDDESQLKKLAGAILSKREYAPKVSTIKKIEPNEILSENNKISIDKLYKGNRKNWPLM